MTHEMMIEILKEDRCTKAEAERYLKNYTTVCDADNLLFLDEYNAGLDEEDRFTLEDIKEGKVTDFSYVELDGKEYYISYVR